MSGSLCFHLLFEGGGEKKKRTLAENGALTEVTMETRLFPFFLLFVNFADAQSMRRPARVFCSESFSASTGLQPAPLD